MDDEHQLGEVIRVTEQYLKDYRKLRLEIETLEESKIKLRNQIAEFQASKFKPIAKEERKTLTDALIRMEALNLDYAKRIGKIMKQRFAVERFIDDLEDPTTRTIFRLRYVEGLEWEEVCVKVHYSWKQVHRKHRRALSNMG